MPLYVVLAGVGRRIVHQFEIELAALRIGPLDANTHGIAQGEDPSFAASIDLVAVLVELVEVVLHFPQRNHAFDVGFVQLDVHAPVAHARDRAEEISLNPQKLAGQCSKLKCCLAYEYDTYVDARKEFPRLREPLQALDGEYYLVKTDILAGTMSFSSSKDTMTNVVTLPVARVKEIIALNRAGKQYDMMVYPDQNHSMLPDATAHIRQKMIDYTLKNL